MYDLSMWWLAKVQWYLDINVVLYFEAAMSMVTCIILAPWRYLRMEFWTAWSRISCDTAPVKRYAAPCGETSYHGWITVPWLLSMMVIHQQIRDNLYWKTHRNQSTADNIFTLLVPGICRDKNRSAPPSSLTEFSSSGTTITSLNFFWLNSDQVMK